MTDAATEIVKAEEKTTAVATEAAAEAAAATAEAIEEIKDNAGVAVAVAVETAKAAEQTAQMIADAAVKTELGRRVETVERGLNECLASLSSLKASMELTQAQIAALPAIAAAAAGPTIVQTEPTGPAQSNSRTQFKPAETLEIVNPEQATLPENEGVQKGPAEKRKRNVI